MSSLITVDNGLLSNECRAETGHALPFLSCLPPTDSSHPSEINIVDLDLSLFNADYALFLQSCVHVCSLDTPFDGVDSSTSFFSPLFLLILCTLLFCLIRP